MVFDCRNCFWKINCIIFCATVQKEKGEQVAPKYNPVNCYWLTISSLGQRKHSADWSSSLIAICMNMRSISERMTTGFSQNLRRIPTKLFNIRENGNWVFTEPQKDSYKVGPVIKLEFKDWLLNLAAAFATLRSFPGLFGLNTG